MNGQKRVVVGVYHSPCGELLLGSYDEKLCLCDWNTPVRRARMDKRIKHVLDAEYEQGTSAVIQAASRMLDEYFARQRREFPVPLLFVGTDFQKRVWEALRCIPYGSCLSYGDLAKGMGMPKAVRAVAAAVGANAVSVIVPCHRVIAGNGTLTGYAGGLCAKSFLLDLETGEEKLCTEIFNKK